MTKRFFNYVVMMALAIMVFCFAGCNNSIVIEKNYVQDGDNETNIEYTEITIEEFNNLSHNLYIPKKVNDSYLKLVSDDNMDWSNDYKSALFVESKETMLCVNVDPNTQEIKQERIIIDYDHEEYARTIIVGHETYNTTSFFAYPADDGCVYAYDTDGNYYKIKFESQYEM